MDRVDSPVISSRQEITLSELEDGESDENRWPMGWTIWFALGAGSALWLAIAAIVWII